MKSRKTVYNLLNQQGPVENGVIEIFNMYDYHIWLICLDGEVIDEIDDTNYEDYVLSNEFLTEVLNDCQLNPKDLFFVEYEFEIFARELVDYDCNNFGYKEIYKLLENNLSQSDNIHMKVIAHGVEMNRAGFIE